MPAHSGQNIRVRGRYFVTSEASGIDDTACSELIDLHNTQFVPAVWLAVPGLPTRYPAKVPYDASAVERLMKLAKEAHSKGRRVVVTFEGRLEYCPRFGTLRTGRSLWAGCGSNGSFPLQLVLGTVEDIRLDLPTLPPPPDPNIK